MILGKKELCLKGRIVLNERKQVLTMTIEMLNVFMKSLENCYQ